jgi:hypothetical protein
MYSPSSPLYYLQGPYLKLMISRPDSPTTFQKSTHRQSSTSRAPSACTSTASDGLRIDWDRSA